MTNEKIIEAINQLARVCNNVAMSKGFYDPAPSALEAHMLIVSEVAEATECYRRNLAGIYFEQDGKPAGEYAELVDVLMRTMDYLSYNGVNIGEMIFKKLEYNMNREYRHGKRI